MITSKILIEDYENCQSQLSWILISDSSAVLNKQAKLCISVVTKNPCLFLWAAYFGLPKSFPVG